MASISEQPPQKKRKTYPPVTAADIAPPGIYEVMLNRGKFGLNSMAAIEGNHLDRSQVNNIWKACVRSQRKEADISGGSDECEIVSVESIKGIGCKKLFVCVVGDFIVLPGPVWVGMKMTALKGRMTSTTHLTSFHNAVNEIQSIQFKDKTALVLLRGGPDELVGDKLKQTGIALCTNSGAALISQYGMLLQRSL